VFEQDVLEGLDGVVPGDPLIVLTWLDRADRSTLRVHPRDDPRNPLQGVFTTRSADRPNPIGLHEVQVVSVDGPRFLVRHLEALDGTPVVDVKPVLGRSRGGGRLQGGAVASRLPAQDMARARRFYSEKLGLEPADERPGGLLYRCRLGEFALFESAGASSGTHTQMGWEVDDVEATVAELRARGVEFEEYDFTTGGIAEIEGNYPSKGSTGERAAWFRDSEGNMIGIGQPIK
jgi:tRNA (Thr-GGU) A37 N-methylase/catechol 2,3-dioxygenase-like lactoylglutathione lyase family enzyme